MKDSMGDRLKKYEDVWRQLLPRRMPLIIRIDGKAFHTFVKSVKCEKPFDEKLAKNMRATAHYLLGVIDGAKVAYQQSDEISILVINYSNLNQEPWFGNNIQKIVSVTASEATAYFNKFSGYSQMATFDSRTFILSKEEVTNYFLWRQQDAIRNAIQMYARSQMSHKECHKKTCRDLLEMFDDNWQNVPEHFKMGSFITKTNINLPFLIKGDRAFIDDIVNVG